MCTRCRRWCAVNVSICAWISPFVSKQRRLPWIAPRDRWQHRCGLKATHNQFPLRIWPLALFQFPLDQDQLPSGQGGIASCACVPQISIGIRVI